MKPSHAENPIGFSEGPMPRELLWRKRMELIDLRAATEKLRREIEEADQAAARADLKDLGPHQRAVLEVLAKRFDPLDRRAFNFRHLIRETGLNRLQVQRACRALRRLGFARQEIGLWTVDGEPWGSGYRATSEGAAYLSDGRASDRAPDDASLGTGRRGNSENPKPGPNL